MKKIIFALVLTSVAALTSFGQVGGVNITPVISLKSANNKPTDTVTSTTAHYMTSGAISGYYKTVTVVASGLEISGTTAGTLTLEASCDGTTWYPYYTGIDTTSGATHYVFSLTDVTTRQGYRWKLYDWGDAYVRVKAVGINTPNVIISATVFGKKD